MHNYDHALLGVGKELTGFPAVGIANPEMLQNTSHKYNCRLASSGVCKANMLMSLVSNTFENSKHVCTGYILTTTHRITCC